ncbi:hypothetical protein OCGS_0960 [Oceaniovalibus guishaninsula JLT2003]|uniref:Uncharacterized protein n=1 Tax=Oceaniovalibus guishaninsula JLT2003 TaxID=1231392 RepID=K2I7D1_9RHOB|nr:hypothetical protein [Oceaniovalibus guishaninsula]EKE44925.1 hypothetical protein OCGS_0960 [Oceaniovalibus guishaninsula JLT2003]
MTLAHDFGKTGSRGMIVLDADFAHVHRDRDFGVIEADVTLLLKWAGQPVRPVTIHTHAGPGPDLRSRLVRDAARLAESFHARHKPQHHRAA